ncbi:glycosyltransferase, partial [Neobacillus drentensis]|uniref:glycosyltransferase n=1 Tax=Neobacillus drentensis TaxID=220684 RepID=UPI002FFFD88C
MEVKVSIIIPVHNVEKFITQCIESLLSQTLKECEFIFINDGSKDRSSEIIIKYKKRDKRIILINQNNGGVSAARNAGLKVATGEYICFVDADDMVEKEMYKVLYETAKYENCDIVVSNFQSEMEGRRVFSNYPFPKNISFNFEYVQQELLPYFIKKDDLNTVCTKIYKKDLIAKADASFPQELALGEDGFFNMLCFSYANSIRFIEYTGYNYREVEGSATRNIIKKDYFNQALEVYN